MLCIGKEVEARILAKRLRVVCSEREGFLTPYPREWDNLPDGMFDLIRGYMKEWGYSWEYSQDGNGGWVRQG